MPQNALASTVAVQGGAQTPIHMQNDAVLVGSATDSRLGLSAATVVKTGEGRIVRFVVTTAGAAGTIHDSATTGSASTLIATIPATVGIYYLDFPVSTGILVTPGSGQVVSVSYS